MNPQTEPHSPFNDTHPGSSNGSQERVPGRGRRRALLERARAYAAAVPANFESKVRSHPYRMAGIACGVGVGIGLVLGSRVLRHAVGAAAAAGLVEVVRKITLEDLDRVFLDPPADLRRS